MTRRHFIALADAIRRHNDTVRGSHLAMFTGLQLDCLARFCAAQNPRFNRDRWLVYVWGPIPPKRPKTPRHGQN